jgi:hypothetical protein
MNINWRISMSRFGSCAAVLLLVALVSAEEPKSEWVKIAPESGKHKLQFPVKPKQTKITGQLAVERENGALLLQVTALPKEIDLGKPDLVKGVFDDGRDGGLKTWKGSTLASEKDVQFQKKFPERDIDFEVPRGLYRTRLILTPTTLYQVGVGGTKDYVDGPEAKRFLESFKLKD